MTTYQLTLETGAPPAGPLFEVTDGERNVRLEISMRRDGQAYDLTDRRAKAKYTRPDGGTAVQEEGITLTEAADGQLQMELLPACFSSGTMELELQIWYTPEPEEGGDSDTPDPEMEAAVSFQFLCLKAKVRKRFQISLDSKRSTGNREFEVVDGDNGNVLLIALTDDGVPVKLRDCFVMAVFSKPNGSIAQQDSNGNGIMIYGENGNELEIELYLSSVSPGLVECELLVFSGEEQDALVTTARFNFSCRRGIANRDTVPETDAWPFLVDLMKGVEGAETARNANEEVRIENENDRIARDHAFRVWEEYDPVKTYMPLNKVAYGGSSYLCIAETTGHAPGDPGYWLLIARHGEDGQGVNIQAEKLLLYANWQDGAQMVYDDNIRANSSGSVVIAQNAGAEQYKAWSRLQPQVTAQEAGSITITARGELTEDMDIPVVLEVRS